MTEKQMKTADTTKAPKKKKSSKGKRKLSVSSIILIVGLVVILIPVLILGYILISASMNTGKPINGDRFVNDLDPAITGDQLKQIETAVSAITGVDEADAVLKTATLRVYADLEDSASAEEVLSKAETVYAAVTDVLSEQTYFTSTETKKMYDLEVHVYNSLDKKDGEDFNYAVMLKTAMMEKASCQLVSEAKDPDLAQELRDEQEAKNNPPEASDEDITVNSGESETEPTENE